jgi:ATP-dependent Clp protease ATP-binding subunit ClpC
MSKQIIKPEGTIIGRAVKLDRYFSNILFRVFFFALWIAGFAGLLYAVAISLGVSFETTGQDGLLLAQADDLKTGSMNLAIVSFGLLFAYLPLRMFYREKVRYPMTLSLSEAKEAIGKGENLNIFSFFSFQLAAATAGLFAGKKKFNSTELAQALLKSKDMNFILLRLGVSKDQLENSLKADSGDPDIDSIISAAFDIGVVEKHHQIEVGDVFIALCKIDPFFKAFVSSLKLEISDIAHVVYWQTSLIRRLLEGRRFLDPNRFRMTGGFGRDWAYGYTPLLRQFGRDLTNMIRSHGLGLEVIGREKEIKQIEEGLLRQNGGDVVLVGEPGIGKRTTVLGLSKKIAEGNIDDRLAFLHVVEVDMEALLSGNRGSGDIAARINQVMNEVISAGNIIVFIENIQNILSSGGAGSVDATELLLPFLDSPSLHLVVSTDVASFNEFIRPRTALLQRLTRISVEESNRAETIRIVEDVVPAMEAKTKSFISYEAIKAAVSAAEKYIMDIPNPEKSIDLLDGAAAHATSARGETIIIPKDISEYVTEKYNVPAAELSGNEKKILLNVEEEMHKSVIGQNEAIKAVSNALKRARTGLDESTKPIGSFLFLGPTGVGKTETAKALARTYFGNEDQMVRFDMSEYQSKEDVYRFIGSNLGGETQGALTTAVRERPFSLLLFDELEKAHPDILDLFLQVLDEGRLTDGLGRKVSFTNSIIICTSNAGANLIRESIQSGNEYDGVKKGLLDYLQKESIYRPEFLNRFTQVVVFAPLSQPEIEKVAALMIAKLEKTVAKNRRIKLEVTPGALAKLAKLGFDPEMGARPMERVIQEKVEDLLANKILSEELGEGDSFVIDENSI